MSLTGKDQQKHPTGTGLESLLILDIDYLRRRSFKNPKEYRWAFGIAALEAEDIIQLSTLSGLSQDPSVAGLMKSEVKLVLLSIALTKTP